MTDATRQRILEAVAKLETLAERNRHQGDAIAGAAGRMADRSTPFLDGVQSRLVTGDPGAAAATRRALLERAHGRRVAAPRGGDA